MVFGNLGDDCATGVAFTRDPATGEKQFLWRVSRQRPGRGCGRGHSHAEAHCRTHAKRCPRLQVELQKVCKLLEKHYREMQDIEFTIEKGKLWMLQTRAGKRTGFAAVRIAVDMVEERIISKKEALLRIEPDQLNQLLRPIFDQQERKSAKEAHLLGKGLPAGPGAATGRVVFHAEDAVEWKKRGERVVLCRIETSPDDIRGMDAAQGILTARGGMTSHAALVARQMGKVCVAGCEALHVDYAARTLRVDQTELKEGDWISIDGSTGEVIQGEIQTLPSEVLQVLLTQPVRSKNHAFIDNSPSS